MKRSLTLLLTVLFMAIGVQAKAAVLSNWELDLVSLGGPDITGISNGVGGIGMNTTINLVQNVTAGVPLPGNTFTISPTSGTRIIETAASYVTAGGVNTTPLLQTGQGTLFLSAPTLTGSVTGPMGTNGFTFGFNVPSTPIFLDYTSPTNVTTQIASLILDPAHSNGAISLAPAPSTSGLLEGADNISGLMTVLVAGVLEDSAGLDLFGSTFYTSISGALGSGINFTAVNDGTTITANDAAVNGNFTISANVPEPTTMMLMGGGVMGLFLLRRRTKA